MLRVAFGPQLDSPSQVKLILRLGRSSESIVSMVRKNRKQDSRPARMKDLPQLKSKSPTMPLGLSLRGCRCLLLQ